MRIVLLLLIFCYGSVRAQISPGIYDSDIEGIHHELKITDRYFIYTIYEESPANFIKTLGGFYTDENGVIRVKLEFNSDYDNDSLKELNIPYTFENGDLSLQLADNILFKTGPSYLQDLDGQWLFATRGPDQGQERRGDENPRKTLKFLMDGHFQWIAYNVDTMSFSGTGGGTFTSQEGVYTENIEFFSKDNSRVGASLKFEYELKDADWHHTGKNSKGEPMYEIWSRRE